MSAAFKGQVSAWVSAVREAAAEAAVGMATTSRGELTPTEYHMRQVSRMNLQTLISEMEFLEMLHLVQLLEAAEMSPRLNERLHLML